MTREEALETLIDNAENGCVDIEEVKLVFAELEQKPCVDCVSRQAVDDAIYDYSRSCDVNYQQIMEFIDKIPPVTPQYTDAEIQKMQEMEQAEIQKAYELGKVEQPKMGRWIEVAKYSDGKHKIKCSECGSHIFDRGHANSYNVKEKYKYCPKCGCRMVEPQKSEEKE